MDRGHAQNDLSEAKEGKFLLCWEPSAGKKEKGISLCKAPARLPANTNDSLYFLQTFQACCLTEETCIDPDAMAGGGGDSFYHALG